MVLNDMKTLEKQAKTVEEAVQMALEELELRPRMWKLRYWKKAVGEY